MFSLHSSACRVRRSITVRASDLELTLDKSHPKYIIYLLDTESVPHWDTETTWVSLISAGSLVVNADELISRISEGWESCISDVSMRNTLSGDTCLGNLVRWSVIE